MINEALAKKIDAYSRLYFSLDKPVPFLDDLFIYPVTVDKYYQFQSNISCLTIDKNTTPQGISMSNLAYLIFLMEDKDTGAFIASQINELFEMIFHIESGKYCANDECKGEKKIISYETIRKNLSRLKTDEDKKNYIDEVCFCPVCHKPLRDTFAIKTENGKKSLMVKDKEITPVDFDELRSIVCYQNIIDFSDEYIDPELKKDMDDKAKMERGQGIDYAPDLEKKLVCISVSSAYKLEDLYNITIRKMEMLLRVADAKEHYFCYKGAECGGLVTFKTPPKHWIYSNNKKNLADEIMTMDAVKDKFKQVT